MGDAPLTRERFVERYGRFFGTQRIETIQKLGYLLIEGRGEGPYLFDTEGQRFLDLWNVGGVNSLGHRHPALVHAMQEALRSEDFGSLFFFSEAKGRLAETLARTAPGRLEVTYPAVTGSEAVDQAIKLARGATGRTEILHGDHGYHGVTGFALTMMAPGEMRDWAEPLIPDFRAVPYGDAASLRDAISERTAAVVLEPVRTDYDGRAPDPDYFPAVRRLCDAHGAKLIVDEVVTGMGRLGHVWGIDRWQVEPDLLVTAKGFSGGLFPVAAVVMRPEILEFFGDNPYRIISSYAWSNVGATVARRAIEETEKLLPEANAMGDRLEAVLLDLAARFPSVIHGVRRTGLLYALDLRDEMAGIGFLLGLFQRGVIAVASSQNLAVPKLYPPLILEDAQIAEFAEKAEDALGALA
ncbi:MAG: aspartate aminotransferase family protein [Deltaproteobacteria bacterium]|nr:MAG: aspartate aminotransferase family protein [Deltaproteobacteria bacterium]